MKACLASVPVPICDGASTSALAAGGVAAGLGVVVVRGLAGGFCGWVCRWGGCSFCCAIVASGAPASATMARGAAKRRRKSVRHDTGVSIARTLQPVGDDAGGVRGSVRADAHAIDL